MIVMIVYGLYVKYQLEESIFDAYVKHGLEHPTNEALDTTQSEEIHYSEFLATRRRDGHGAGRAVVVRWGVGFGRMVLIYC